MLSGTQSGGRRRATAPGDLEARQAAMTPMSTGNALSGKSSKELKAARMKVAYNNVKSGKTNIGGKLTGGGFGVGAVAGTAAMFAPPEMQGMLGTISMVSSMVGMFGGQIGKIVPKLLEFLPAISRLIPGLGLVVTAITAAVWIFGELDKAAKERIKNEKALSNAMKTSAEGIKGAADFFGITLKEKIGSNAGVITNPGITGARASVSQQLLKNTEFKKENASQIDALKRATTEDAKRALATIAAEYSSRGFGKDAVQAIVDAMVTAAGRKDVSLKFKSINVDTKEGRAGQAKELATMLEQKIAKANTSATETKTVQGYMGRGYIQILQRTGTEMQNLFDVGKAFGTQLSALQESFNDGTMSLKEYNKQLAILQKLIKDKAKNPADMLTIMKTAIKTMNPEMGKLVKGIKDFATLARVAQATMLGMEISPTALRDLKTAKSVAEAIAILNAGKALDKAIDEKLKKIKGDLADALDTTGDVVLTATEKRINALQKAIDKLNLGLDLIGMLEEKVNKKYDKRIEALQKVKEIQSEISAQQKDQLDLADALTRGDIAGAAKAAQQMRANNAQRALDSQTTAIENARTLELSKITNSSGQTRAQLEARIARLELLILKREGAASGGYITGAGSGTSDSIPAMLSNGEYVVRANAVKAIGVDTLDKLNHADKNKFADGGLAAFRMSEHKGTPKKQRFGINDIAAGLTNPIIQGGANGTDVMGGFATAESYINVASGKGGFFDYLTAILTPFALTGFGGASKIGMFGKLASKLRGGIKATALNQTGVNKYLGDVKNGSIWDYLTPGQNKYLSSMFINNPENIGFYMNKIAAKNGITRFNGPGRGIPDLGPASIKSFDGNPEKLLYQPNNNQFLDDLINVILPNAKGQSASEILKLKQLLKLTKPYKKDLSKMPGGLRAAVEDMFAIHRSFDPKLKTVAQNKVMAQSNMFGGPLEGPGTYTSGTLKISDQHWSDYAGDNLYRQSYSDAAFKQVLKSKGYADDNIIAQTILSNPSLKKKYGDIVENFGNGQYGVNLQNLGINEPLFKTLMKNGYMGYRVGPSTKTNWMIGQKGFGLEKFEPNMNSLLGYAKGGMVKGYSEGGSPSFQKSNVGRMSPTPLFPAGNSSLPSYDWSGTNQKFGVGKANGGLIKPAYMSGGGSPIDFKPKGMDRIPAMLSKDEYVMKGSAVRKYGTGVMDAINNKTFGMKTPSFKDPSKTLTQVLNDSSKKSVITNVNNSSPVYNINISTNSNASPTDIANLVSQRIKSVDSQRLKESRF